MVWAPDVSFGTFLVTSLKFLSSTDSQLDNGTDGNLSGATFTPACCSLWCLRTRYDPSTSTTDISHFLASLILEKFLYMLSITTVSYNNVIFQYLAISWAFFADDEGIMP